MADDDLFLSKMRLLGVQPLKENRRRKAAPPPEPETLFDLELDDTESDLFLEAMGDMGFSSGKTSKKSPSEKPSQTPAQPESTQPETLSRSPSRTAAARAEDDEDRLLFLETLENLPTPDKDAVSTPEPSFTVRKLKAPRNTVVEPDDTLDLHRLKVQEALTLLKSFITRARHYPSSLVLIITGKGHHSKDGIPVLKREVEAWIRSKEGKVAVQAYSEAAPAQGGRGALLLYLRQPADH